MLQQDEDLSQDIQLHLQSSRKFFSATAIVDFLSTPEMIVHLGIKKPITE
jgi:hypothetical protein